jgi:hypothetical protein
MITKAQLKADKDEQNRAKYQFDMPWDETSIARVYDKIDASVEGGALIDIVSVEPISYNPDTQTMKIEVVLGLDDLFSEEDVDSEGETE